MRAHVLPAAVGLCLCLVLAARAGAEVTAADFDVAPDQVDAAVDRLAAADFADVARPAATVLARRKPEFLPAGRDPRMTDAQYEAFRRRHEAPAYTVGRLVWERRTAGADGASEAAARVLGEVATDRGHADADVREVAVRALVRPALSRGTLTDAQRAPLYRVAMDEKDDPGVRCLAAQALMHALARDDKHPDQYGDVLRALPAIVRAQKTLAARHEAFNELTNIGNRLYDVPRDRLADLIRLGFGLIEETPPDTSAGAYGTARRLGFMLKRPDEFAPPQAEHKDGTGNLAPSFFLKTVQNARRWWDEAGRRVPDAAPPAADRR